MKVLRTPDERFANLPDYPFAPHYLQIDTLRMHYVDEGPRDGAIVLMLHGEPSWSYLYRHMIPLFMAEGYRAIAPDLIGFGKSDKPAEQEHYTYQGHVDWMQAWLEQLDLQNITLICQDWGSLIGLRLVAAHPDRFARVVLSNGGLPTGDERISKAFEGWQQLSQTVPELPVGQIINGGCVTDLSAAIIAAYDAPFPDESYKAAARIFPMLMPTQPDDPASAANRAAWQVLEQWQKPFLTAFGDRDPITKGADKRFQQRIPGAAGQPHTIIERAGHFIQEDRGPQLAQVVLDFLEAERAS